MPTPNSAPRFKSCRVRSMAGATALWSSWSPNATETRQCEFSRAGCRTATRGLPTLLDSQLRKECLGRVVRPKRNLAMRFAQLQIIHHQRRLCGPIHVKLRLRPIDHDLHFGPDAGLEIDI